MCARGRPGSLYLTNPSSLLAAATPNLTLGVSPSDDMKPGDSCPALIPEMQQASLGMSRTFLHGFPFTHVC